MAEQPLSKKPKLDEDINTDSTIEKEKGAEYPSPKCETDVGITEYITPGEGFSAIIKQRYSDFLVNEVDTDGNIVRLTNIDVPTIDEEMEAEKPKNPDLLEIITEEQIEEVRKVEKNQTGEVWILVGDNKEKRTKVHSVIRENFNNLESSTTEKDGQKHIKICSANVKHNFNKFQREHHRKKPAWPKGKPEYCQFVLYKENHDTPNAINQIAKVLRMNTAQFAYAGTKDKRAKSSQLITVSRVTATRLHCLNKRFKLLVLGNFKYVSKPLKLGELKGNHFTIVLRNVTGTEEQINSGISSLKEIGFINYFGMQRFGTAAIPTHDIGKAVLQNKWTEVVDLIMQPRNDGISKARNIWRETQDAKKALDALGHQPCIEKHLLTGLAKSSKKDIVGALSYIPRNSRHMYLHSYQSYVWNNMVSKRIVKYGLKPIVGDLVLKSKEDLASDEESVEEECKNIKPLFLTEENLSSYTIYDVVLPLPGFDVVLPAHDLAEEYTQFLSHDEVTFDSFKHKVRDYAMPGGYRAILVKPENFQHCSSYYNDHNIPLVLSDYEKLKGETLDKDSTQESAYKALKLEFTLPRSTYATMAIREVLKNDTSANEQIKLNVAGVSK